MAKSPQEVGKEFEEKFRAALKAITLHKKAAVHRLYDAHSSGGYMPEQPGDFFFLYDRTLHVFELKSSAKHQTLASGLSDLMDTGQAAQLRWWTRAGAVAHVLFLSQQDGAIELWNGDHVGKTFATSRARLKEGEGVVYFLNFKGFMAKFESALEINPRFGAPGVGQ